MSSEIKDRLEQMNTSMDALQTLAQAYDGLFFISSVNPVTEDKTEKGYIVKFSNGQEIYIDHGDTGKDAVCPVLSIAKEADGFWYWVLDGEYILNAAGERIRLYGENGKDAISPILDIQDNKYIVSYDNGKTWIEVGQVKGDKGDDGLNANNIQSIDCTTSPDYVIFTFLDGSSMKIYTISSRETLQKIRARLNSNIFTLWNMLKANDTRGYIRSVSNCIENGDKIGYELEFNDNTKTIVYDNIVETDLWYPTIYLSSDTSGSWRWLMDEKEISRDEMSALEMYPKLKVEDNIWYYSIDNGKAWTEICDANTTRERENLVTGIETSDSKTLKVIQGNRVEICTERIPSLYIRFSKKDDIGIRAGGRESISYEILEGEGNIQVGVITADLWEAEVRKETDRTGTIIITAPDPYCDENVKVMVSCNGSVIMETLTFCEKTIGMESLNIIQDQIELYEGFSETLETEILPDSTSNKTLEWRSANPEIAVVGPQGRVVAVSEGITEIYASAQGFSDMCRVIVNKYEIHVSSITIPTPEIILEKNTSGHIYVKIIPFNAIDKTITWSSSSPDIVEITETGTIYARKTGEAIITASHNDLRAQCKVTVIEEDLSDMERVYTVNGVDFKMIRVKKGTFLMGNEEFENARPVRDVAISKDYFIAETETTRELWKAIHGREMGIEYINDTDNLRWPVTGVYWDHIQEFLQELNELTGEKFRLPTEAEWEYAAKGGNKSKGYRFSGSDEISEVAWFVENSGEGYTDPVTGFPERHVHPVKLKKPNELGLYDMTGNADEWCSDYYQVYPSEPETDPIGGTIEPGDDPWGGYYHSSYRVHRGGNYNNGWEIAVSYRKYLEPGYPYDVYCFRLVLPAE